jgi:glycerophosphoryl diester phosphodiesterase
MPVLVALAALAAKPFFDRPFLLGAHRGGVLSRPENTVLAFKEAARRYPDILLETDVRTTKDGQLVLLHDETVDRTTDGTGKVSTFTLEALRKLDAGFRFTTNRLAYPYRGKDVRIATLEEALDAAPQHRFELDIKSPEIADKVADLLVRKNAVDRVLFASFVPAAMARIRARLPQAAVCYDFANGAKLLAALRGTGWAAYQPEADVLSMMKEQVASYKVTDEEIRRIREKGIRFQIHTLNDEAEMQRWRRVGVDSILTDRPDQLAYELFGKAMLRGHAHNDYEHPRPLLDALDQGFGSVEADIFLVDGELRVGHDRQSLRPGRTLESLYLDPLLARVRENGGTVHPWPGELTLLVDIKADGEKVYQELAKRLVKYQEMLTTYPRPTLENPTVLDLAKHADAQVKPGAVRIVISGDRPVDTINKDGRGLMFIDGRLSDITVPPTTLPTIPLISDSYGDKFKWNGNGDMSADERFKLRRMVQQAHAQGAKFRLWGVPDTPDAWREFYDAGVDLVNTDKLAPLADFLRKQS